MALVSTLASRKRVGSTSEVVSTLFDEDWETVTNTATDTRGCPSPRARA